MHTDSHGSDVERAAPAAAILPCPFCGSPGKLASDVAGQWHRVMCCNPQCRTTVNTLDYSAPETAITVWNTRREIGNRKSQIANGGTPPFIPTIDRLDWTSEQKAQFYRREMGQRESIEQYVDRVYVTHQHRREQLVTQIRELLATYPPPPATPPLAFNAAAACPFCGVVDIVFNDVLWAHCCKGCGAHGPDLNRDEPASLQAWNMRNAHHRDTEARRDFLSCAQWPASVSLGTSDNVSTDTHATRAAAEAVCRALQRDGFGGDGKVFPLKVWVAESSASVSPCLSGESPSQLEQLAADIRKDLPRVPEGGLMAIAAERFAQIHTHGYGAEHDDTDHADGSLVDAARLILGFEAMRVDEANLPLRIARQAVRHDLRHRLAIAGALIAAEIDRLDRADASREAAKNAKS